METVNDRLDTLERFQRLHAQSIAFCDESITVNKKATAEIATDFEKYKQYITTIHKKIDSYVNERLSFLFRFFNGPSC